MSPFRRKETEAFIPRGQTEIAEGVHVVQPIDAPDDEARIILGDYKAGTGVEDEINTHKPISFDIVGKEGKDILIVPPSKKPVTLTYEPTIEIQAARIIWDREFERYFPLTDKVNAYMIRKMENMSELKKFAATGVFALPFIGAMVSDLVLMAPRRASDFLTRYWQKEKLAVETELKEKKGLASGR